MDINVDGDGPKPPHPPDTLVWKGKSGCGLPYGDVFLEAKRMRGRDVRDGWAGELRGGEFVCLGGRMG